VPEQRVTLSTASAKQWHTAGHLSCVVRNAGYSITKSGHVNSGFDRAVLGTWSSVVLPEGVDFFVTLGFSGGLGGATSSGDNLLESSADTITLSSGYC